MKNDLFMTDRLREYLAKEKEDKKIYCIYREEKPWDVYLEVYHCKLHKDITHCCGRNIGNCSDYKLRTHELSLFN